MIRTNCPTDDELRAFGSGRLSSKTVDSVAQHVEECADCESRLGQFDESADEFVVGLRECATPAENQNDFAVPASVAEAVDGVATLSRCGTGSSVSMDPGKRYARRLADGPVFVDRFELLDELGDGSFGYVFKARDTELDRVVALKVQRAGEMATDEDVARFLREARNIAQLSHSSIVSLYESGQTEDGVCYLVTEYVEGRTLDNCDREISPNWREIARQIAELAAALDYAHKHGVVHRDIKPSNIMIDHDARPHVMDFGLARRDTGDATLTSDGRIMGTPAYMSPEQARGDSHAVDARTDIYSLGVVLFETLTGERPFQGNRRMLILQVLDDEPRPPRQLDDTIPRDLETVCLKAMAKSPGRRYQSARELADDLRRYLNGEPVYARPVGNLERLWRWTCRYPLATSLFIALLIGSTAGFVHLSSLTKWFIHQTALDGARIDAEMLEIVFGFYSDALGNLETGTVDLSHEFASQKGTLPWPATFTIDAGIRISESECGLLVRLCSEHPWRKDAQKLTDFEQRALTELSARAVQGEDELFLHEFREEGDRQWLYLAKGQLMKKSCIDCHKTHALSPKKDWKEGDLAGALILARPLDQDIARTEDGLRGAFVLMGSVFAVPAGIGMIFVVNNRRRRRSGVSSR
jgi:hypothetical protein